MRLLSNIRRFFTFHLKANVTGCLLLMLPSLLSTFHILNVPWLIRFSNFLQGPVVLYHDVAGFSNLILLKSGDCSRFQLVASLWHAPHPHTLTIVNTKWIHVVLPLPPLPLPHSKIINAKTLSFVNYKINRWRMTYECLRSAYRSDISNVLATRSTTSILNACVRSIANIAGRAFLLLLHVLLSIRLRINVYIFHATWMCGKWVYNYGGLNTHSQFTAVCQINDICEWMPTQCTAMQYTTTTASTHTHTHRLLPVGGTMCSMTLRQVH